MNADQQAVIGWRRLIDCWLAHSPAGFAVPIILSYRTFFSPFSMGIAMNALPTTLIALAACMAVSGCAKQPSFAEADAAYQQEKRALDAMEREFTESAEYEQALEKVAKDMPAAESDALKNDLNEQVCRMKEDDGDFAEFLARFEPKLTAQRNRVVEAWKRRTAANK